MTAKIRKRDLRTRVTEPTYRAVERFATAHSATQTLKLIRTDPKDLRVDLDRFGDMDYTFTQQIGSAVAFLGNDGLIVPSARWDCENLILFDDGTLKTKFQPLGEPEQIDWQSWCKDNDRWTPEPDPDQD